MPACSPAESTLTLLAYTGMKLQEALELHTLDFDWKQAEVTVHAG
jgi:hypothetical protein